MRDSDYVAEYERRLNQWHGSADAWHGAQHPQAEDLPNPCRTMTVWDEEEDRLVTRRVEVDEDAVDRGEG